MARTPGPGKCVHCLKDVQVRNWDHVFPASWYPDTTPPNLEKWQIPSCIPCNSEYGKLESDFLVKVALCLSPDHPASRSIVENAMRSVRPSAGRDERDAMHRLKRGRSILNKALTGEQIPDHGLYPGLSTNLWAEIGEEPVAILVPVQSFRLITEKIVRGLFYVQEGRLIESPYFIEFLALDGEGAAIWEGCVEKYGTVYARGPGLVIRRAVAVEDGISSLFAITFWEQFKTYASVEDGLREKKV